MDKINELDEITKKLEDMKATYNTDLGKSTELKAQIDELDEEIKNFSLQSDSILTMKTILEESSSEARENGAKILSQIASSALQMVFEGNTSIDLILDKKSGEPVAYPRLKNVLKDGKIIADLDPAEDDGGGLADIVDTTFFMTFGKIGGEKNTAGFMLDEPSKYVSRGELSRKFAGYFKGLVDYIGKQTILSTHDDYLLNAGDTAYKLILDNDTGITTVEKQH